MAVDHPTFHSTGTLIRSTGRQEKGLRLTAASLSLLSHPPHFFYPLPLALKHRCRLLVKMYDLNY